MKEVMAIIRQENINKTKNDLVKEGFPSLTARKVLGRGRMSVEFDLAENSGIKAEGLSRGSRLMPKRIITIIVKDEEVDKVVGAIIRSNSKGNKGDGKIFVLPVTEVYRVRDNKRDNETL
ncbi:MAG: P-II family nitrogen regulator [bacterium]